MFDKPDLVRCSFADLEGKTLKLSYGYERPIGKTCGEYCLLGWDKETETKYLIAFEREIR